MVPFPIACGVCGACERGMTSLCENSNPNAGIAEKLMGHSPAALFGYSHMLGGYPGGQAEYARVPFADFGAAQGRARPPRREGPVPLGHLPHRVHGRRHGRGRSRRRRRGVGRRPRRPVRHRELLPARSRAGHRHRPHRPTGCGWRAGDRGRDAGLRTGVDPGGAQGDDRGTRARQVHRRGGDGGPPRRRGAPRLRPHQAGRGAGDRTAARAPRGHHELRQRGHRVGHRGLRRASPTSSRWDRS